MEAETYLTQGYGIRLALEAKAGGWSRFSAIASAAAPPRIKQVLVAKEFGTPYLNTSQVFDTRPRARKWLAMGKTAKAQSRLVQQGTILLMASATVGRAIVATKAHENCVVSHHFMRVTPFNTDMNGWVYAYLRSPQALAMMSGSQYASVIRHIEPHHLATLPVPDIPAELAATFQSKLNLIIEHRNRADRLRDAAEKLFSESVGPVLQAHSEVGFQVQTAQCVRGRRRLDAAYYSPQVSAIIGTFASTERLGNLTKRVWWPNRFRRIYGDVGTPYMSADDVFTSNPHSLKSIIVDGKKDSDDFHVEDRWIVMARSGQIYGLNGSAMLTTSYHKGFFLSDDMIRIIPDPAKARPGYLLTALTHPVLGRPLLIREAYGMSIPHLDPGDVASFPVVRLEAEIEGRIADMAEESAEERARAEALEREIANDAGTVISGFLMRSEINLHAVEDPDFAVALNRLAEMEKFPEKVLRGASLDEKMKQWEA